MAYAQETWVPVNGTHRYKRSKKYVWSGKRVISIWTWGLSIIWWAEKEERGIVCGGKTRVGSEKSIKQAQTKLQTYNYTQFLCEQQTDCSGAEFGCRGLCLDIINKNKNKIWLQQKFELYVLDLISKHMSVGVEWGKGVICLCKFGKCEVTFNC